MPDDDDNNNNNMGKLYFQKYVSDAKTPMPSLYIQENKEILRIKKEGI